MRVWIVVLSILCGSIAVRPPGTTDAVHLLLIRKAPKGVDEVKLLNALDNAKLRKALPEKGVVSIEKTPKGFYIDIAPLLNHDGKWAIAETDLITVKLSATYKILFIGYPF